MSISLAHTKQLQALIDAQTQLDAAQERRDEAFAGAYSIIRDNKTVYINGWVLMLDQKDPTKFMLRKCIAAPVDTSPTRWDGSVPPHVENSNIRLVNAPS